MIRALAVVSLAIVLAVAVDVGGGSGNSGGRVARSGQSVRVSSNGVRASELARSQLMRVSRVRPNTADPSGRPMPRGDRPGWKQIFADNFAKLRVPLGTKCGDSRGFPHRLSRWAAYPYPWKGTPSWGIYCPERTTSIFNGVMDIWLHSESVGGTTLHLIDAVLPRIVGYPHSNGQTYGRYVIRYYQPASFGMFHLSWLLWPDSDVWPRDGEIDFPEGDTNSTISAYMHWRNATSDTEQDAFSTGVPIHGRWHTAVIEWLPKRVTFLLDGKVVGTTNDQARIPNASMHFVIQNNGSNEVAPDDWSQGHIYIDWVTIYAPTGAS